MSTNRLPKSGDTVIATPHEDDFSHEFEGTVTGTRKDTDGRILYAVVDGEGDTFECYDFQLKVQE